MAEHADDQTLLDRILAEEPPTRTVAVKYFANSPEPTPTTVRLLDDTENDAVRKAVGALTSDEEKAGAWIREPLVYALVSIGPNALPAIRGVSATARETALSYRHTLLGHLTAPIIATIYQAYSELDAEEMAAQRQVVDAKKAPGAASGPRSRANGSGRAGDSPSAA